MCCFFWDIASFPSLFRYVRGPAATSGDPALPSTLGVQAETDSWKRLAGGRCVPLNRREALWQVMALDPSAAPETLLLFAAADRRQPEEPEVELPVMQLGEHVIQDYRSIRLSLKAHPMALLIDQAR